MEYTKKQIEELAGGERWALFERLNEMILEHYDMEQAWDKGGRDWAACLRYRRGGKTLCTVYFRKGEAAVLVIFGKKEREKFEETKKEFSDFVQEVYHSSKTYHDGKWMLFDMDTEGLLSDMEKLLAIKRKQAIAKL